MFLLQEGQLGEPWAPSKKQWSFGNRGALRRKARNFTFLGPLDKFRKATVSFVSPAGRPSVRVHGRTQLPLDRFS
jgi:hypothetical protein